MDETTDSPQNPVPSPDSTSEEPNSPPSADLDRLRRLIQRLRAPGGCPWDREQTLADVRAYLIEEAHEAAAALDLLVEAGEGRELEEELGDLLFQVSFVAVLAEEADHFTLAEAITGVERKMIDRHPHVFAGEEVADAAEVRQRWEKRKQRAQASALDGVPRSLPALTAAYRMTQKAGALGFDWPDHGGVLAKLEEELDELRAVLADREPAPERLRDEVGDLLFTVANLARHLGVDPEAALAGTNQKFRRRFTWVERGLDPDEDPPDLARLEKLWQEAKERERRAP